MNLNDLPIGDTTSIDPFDTVIDTAIVSHPEPGVYRLSVESYISFLDLAPLTEAHPDVAFRYAEHRFGAHMEPAGDMDEGATMCWTVTSHHPDLLADALFAHPGYRTYRNSINGGPVESFDAGLAADYATFGLTPDHPNVDAVVLDGRTEQIITYVRERSTRATMLNPTSTSIVFGGHTYPANTTLTVVGDNLEVK